MKRFSIILFVFVLSLFMAEMTTAQRGGVRPSLKASVSQTLGTETNITISYCRPGVKGRKIWGGLVPYGATWRAGANENTTIEFSTDVTIEGKKIAAGKYGVHMIPSEGTWVIAFSTKNNAWGSFAYKKEEDALRITVTPKKAPHQEWLSFGFEDLAGTSSTVFLYWEKLKVPFKVEVAK